MLPWKLILVCKTHKTGVFYWVWGLNQFLSPKLPLCQISCLLLFVHNFCTSRLDYKFISKYQKEILGCAPPSSHVCDFIFFNKIFMIWVGEGVEKANISPILNLLHWSYGHGTWTEGTLAWKHFKIARLSNNTTHLLLKLALLVKNGWNFAKFGSGNC